MNQDFLYDIGNVAGRTLDAPTMIARNLLAGNDLTSGVFSGEGSTPDDVEGKLGIDASVGGGAAGETIAMLLGGLLAGGLGSAVMLNRKFSTAKNPTSIEPGWYSRLNRAVESLPDGEMPMSRALNLMRKAKEGFSPEEFEWRNMGFFDPSETITRDQLLGHLEANPLTLTASTRHISPYSDYSLASPREDVVRARRETGATFVPAYREHVIGFNTDDPGYNSIVAGTGGGVDGPLSYNAPMDVIAHLRTTEHEHPQLGNTLFLNEAQSDHHQSAQAGMHGELPRGYTHPEIENQRAQNFDYALEKYQGIEDAADYIDEDILSKLGGDRHAKDILDDNARRVSQLSGIKRDATLSINHEGPYSIVLSDGEQTYPLSPEYFGKEEFDPGDARMIADAIEEFHLRDRFSKLMNESSARIEDYSYADKYIKNRIPKKAQKILAGLAEKTGIDTDAIMSGGPTDWNHEEAVASVDKKYGIPRHAPGDWNEARDLAILNMGPNEYLDRDNDLFAVSRAGREIDALKDLAGTRDSVRSVANYPYKDSWEDLLVRKLIHEAVKNGDDAIGVADPGIMTGLMQTTEQNSNLGAMVKKILSYMRSKGDNPVVHDTPIGKAIPMSKSFVDNIRNNGQYLMSALPIAALLAQGNNDG